MHTIADPQLLSERQQELICAAASNQGNVAILARAQTRGRAACCGRKAFFEPSDLAIAGQYIEALHDLVELQLLRGSGKRESYELTNSGWQISRKLS